MTVGVILLPFAHNNLENAYSNDVINLGYLSGIQRRQLRDVEAKFGAQVPDFFFTFLNQEDGSTEQTAYGKPLQYVRARQLKPIFKKWATNRETKIAGLAYVAALPDDWPVALYWN